MSWANAKIAVAPEDSEAGSKMYGPFTLSSKSQRVDYIIPEEANPPKKDVSFAGE